MKIAGTYQSYLNAETMRVVAPYMVISAVTCIWAILLLFTKFPHLSDEHIVNGKEEKGSFRELFRFRHFKLGVLAQFFYVGAQVGTWSYFILYAQDYAHMAEKTAGYFLAGTLGAFLIGRFSVAFIMRYVKPRSLMGVFALINICLVAISAAFPGIIGLWAVLSTSFFMSLMFPTIFALGVKGLGPNTKVGGSMIIMGIIGGAVFTPVMGIVARHSMALAMIVPLCCYVYITFYAFVGSEPRGPLYEGNFLKPTASH